MASSANILHVPPRPLAGLKVIPTGLYLVCLLMVSDKVKNVLVAILNSGRVTPVTDSGHKTINVSYEWHNFVYKCEHS